MHQEQANEDNDSNVRDPSNESNRHGIAGPSDSGTDAASTSAAREQVRTSTNCGNIEIGHWLLWGSVRFFATEDFSTLPINLPHLEKIKMFFGSTDDILHTLPI